MSWRSSVSVLLILGAICFQFAAVRSGPVWNPGNANNRKPSTVQNAGEKQPLDTSDSFFKAFSNIVNKQLENNDILKSLFSYPVDASRFVNIAFAVVDSLVIEIGVVDSHKAVNSITKALFDLGSRNAGSEAYCKTFLNSVEEIVLASKILNSNNYIPIANTVIQIILRSSSDLLKSRKIVMPTDKIGLDLGIGVNAGLDIGVGSIIPGPGVNTANLNIYSDIGLSTKANLDANVNISSSVGAKIDLSASEVANLDFETKLKMKLLNDTNFRYVFSGNIPPNVLGQIAGALCQYISKAFAISRSLLLPLEDSIVVLSFESTPSLELYADIITGTLTNIFAKLNLIKKDAVCLLANIASNATTSAIESFMRISSITGLGLTENFYNSYFSALNGLEKLPYAVGVEADSLRLPPVLRIKYASMYAAQFAKILLYNLVSSRKFSEVFSQCAPTFINKKFIKSLGNFMAEVFGSPNPQLFYDSYCKALLTPTAILNRVNFARALSFATARALYFNGYFLSGNIYIQAAIAKNSIIRALTTKSKYSSISTHVALFQNVSELPRSTQLDGVLPSQILLKYGIDVGALVQLNTNLGAGVAISTGLEAASNTNTNFGLGLDMDAGLGTGLSVNAGQKKNAGLEAGIGMSTGLGVGIISNTGVTGGIGVGAGLMAGLGINSGLGADLGAKADLGLGAYADLGAYAGLGAYESLGAYEDLGAFQGLGAYGSLDSYAEAGLNAGLGAKLDINTNGRLGVNFGSQTGSNENAFSGVNFGLQAGSNENAFSGVNFGLQAGSNENAFSGINFGLQAGSDLEQNFHSGTREMPRKKRSADELPFLEDWIPGFEELILGTDEEFDLFTKTLTSTTTAGSKIVKEQKSEKGTKAGKSGVHDEWGAGVRTGAGLDLGVEASADLGVITGVKSYLVENVGLDTNIGAAVGLNAGVNSILETTVKGDSSNTRFAIVNILPLILANKLYESTSLYTSISIVGAQKVIYLISKAMASAFGIPIAAIFWRSYEQCVINTDKSFEKNMVCLAKATTEALAGIGFLNSKFSISKANQLAIALVSKFSCLIATSLEVKEYALQPQWSYILSQDLIQPPLTYGYSMLN